MSDTETISGFFGEYRFLSNFYPSIIRMHQGITYPTAEHAYQACKALNEEQRIAISQEPTPGAAKRAGRRLLLRPDWNSAAVRNQEMLRVTARKFLQNDDLMSLLLATGDAALVETNTWHDTYWGQCVCDKHQGEGDNRLGRILMDHRTRWSN